MKSISLVLGSGGARGYAHIGVIEELEKHGYEINSISGSSMGALIGALQARGKLQEYKDWILGLDLLDVAKLVDFSFSGVGIIQGDKVFSVIEEMIGEVLIEDLDISYTAVATDIIKQKEVWLQKGNLVDAVRASIAIPSIFTPKNIGGRYMVDGGVLNPLPIAPTVADESDITVAVNLGGVGGVSHKIKVPKKQKEKQSKMRELYIEMRKKTDEFFPKEEKSEIENMGMFDILGRSIDIMQNAVLECKMAGYSPDIIINIPNDACGFYEFHKGYEMIELGRMITREVLTHR